MKSYRNTTQSLMSEFKHVMVEAIRRALNSRADVLAKRTASEEYRKKTKLVVMEDMTEGKGPERLYKVNMVDVVEGSSKGDDWIKEMVDFLQESILSKDKAKARKIRLKVARYTIVRGVLYRKSFSGPLLRCLTKDEATKVMNAIHSGVCGNHLGGRNLVDKEITSGYFWLYMMQDAMKFFKICEKCKKHAPLIHQYSEPCHSVVSP